jgi:hypothetical protein
MVNDEGQRNASKKCKNQIGYREAKTVEEMLRRKEKRPRNANNNAKPAFLPSGQPCFNLESSELPSSDHPCRLRRQCGVNKYMICNKCAGIEITVRAQTLKSSCAMQERRKVSEWGIYNDVMRRRSLMMTIDGRPDGVASMQR